MTKAKKELDVSGVPAHSPVEALASLIIKTTVHTGGDVAVATQDLLKGVFHSARHIGVDAEQAVSEAADRAVKIGYEIGAEIGDKVKYAAHGAIDGFKNELK